MQPPVLLELREEMSTSDAYPGDLDHKFLEKWKKNCEEERNFVKTKYLYLPAGKTKTN